jgi:hypothetical protein
MQRRIDISLSQNWKRPAALVEVAQSAVLAEVLEHDLDHRLVGHAVIQKVDGGRPREADGPPHRQRGLIDEAQRTGVSTGGRCRDELTSAALRDDESDDTECARAGYSLGLPPRY